VDSGLGFRGGPRWMCFPREEKLSFLWRTMLAIAGSLWSVLFKGGRPAMSRRGTGL
jgi:hypothetical protein